MKSKILILVLVFVAASICGACSACGMGNGSVTSQERTATGFNGVALVGAGNVIVHPNEDYNVIVSTDSNLQARVLTAVNGNTLRILLLGSSIPTELTIDVFLPELASIAINGTGNFTINGGNTSTLFFSLTGTGNINAENFQVENVTISHTGVGTAKIWATNYLNGTLTGVGKILYRGNPKLNIKRVGIGSITPLYVEKY